MFSVNKERNVVSVARVTCTYVVIQTLISYIAICSGHKKAPNQRISTRNIHLLPTVLVASQKAVCMVMCGKLGVLFQVLAISVPLTAVSAHLSM